MKFIKVLMVAMLMFSVLPAVPAHAHHEIVTVKKGDSLSKIAMRHDVPGNWQRLAGRNRIPNPDLLRVGQKLILPHRNKTRKGELLVRYPNYKRAQKPPPRRPDVAASRSARGVYEPWISLQKCESGGSGGWQANTGNGYYGGLQFSLSSWRAVGGQGYPHQNSPAEQVYRGEKLQDAQGWGAWPSCSKKIGLR